jgi:hypothetical protein
LIFSFSSFTTTAATVLHIGNIYVTCTDHLMSLFPFLGNVSLALFASAVSAFTPASTTRGFAPLKAAQVDDVGNNVAIKNLLQQVESTRLLSKVAQAGILSKAQASGITLSKLEPLLKLAASNKEVMILLEAATPEALPLLPKLVEVAPGALPLLGAAIQVSPGTLQAAAGASLAAAAGGIYLIPDDTVVQIAAQTLIGGTLGLAIPAASVIGATVISKIKA